MASMCKPHKKNLYKVQHGAAVNCDCVAATNGIGTRCEDVHTSERGYGATSRMGFLMANAEFIEASFFLNKNFRLIPKLR